ncbi:MAG: putative motility protein [Clostridia bacterium]|nr:putative motility protein [Clostridia bacterium]
MQISSYQSANLASLKQAIGMANIQRAMKQDAQSMETIIKSMEQSVTPHKGGSIDVKV